MIQALIHERGESYEIDYAISNIERMHNKKQEEKKMVENIILEGYSRKK